MKKVFYAAKVNVHENIFNQNLQEIIRIHIPRVVLSMPTIRINSFNLSFTDAVEVYHEGHKLIIGNITKSKHASQKVKIGSSTNFVKSEHELARTSFFVYHPENEIITYEVNSSITDSEFRSFFTAILSRDNYVGEVKIKTVPEPYKIRSEIQAMQTVTTVHFHLIHPNPGKKEFNLYNQIIQDNKLKELEIKMNNDKGLELRRHVLVSEQPTKQDSQEDILLPSFIELEDIQKEQVIEANKTFTGNEDLEFTESIENGISLVESGYGTVDIKGYDEITVEGKRKKARKVKRNRFFSSKKSVRMVKTNEYSQERLLTRLLNFIVDVKNKAVKGGEQNDTTETF